MTRRRKVVVVCEDAQGRSFTLQALRAYGFHPHAIRVVPLPSKVGGGAGHAWVAAQDPRELDAARRAGAATSLVAHIDADEHTVAQRHVQLRDACTTAGVVPRAATEAVAELVPRRNIETWIYALDEELAGDLTLSEHDDFRKLKGHERDCRAAARAFADHARQRTAPATTTEVPSLVDGLAEFRRVAPQE